MKTKIVCSGVCTEKLKAFIYIPRSLSVVSGKPRLFLVSCQASHSDVRSTDDSFHGNIQEKIFLASSEILENMWYDSISGWLRCTPMRGARGGCLSAGRVVRGTPLPSIFPGALRPRSRVREMREG